MFVPRARQGVHVPGAMLPFALATAAVLVTLIAWAAVSVRSTGDGSSSETAAFPAPALRSVAYLLPGLTADELHVRPLDGGPPRLLATFPRFLQIRPVGSTSPGGERVAVLHVVDRPEPNHMSLVSIADGARIDVAGEFDPRSRIAWAPGGARLAATHSRDGETAVVEIDAVTGAAFEAASFPGALEVAPVGYSYDGRRLFVVVVDTSGSSLWAIRDRTVQKVAAMSPGPTRDWALSPDGARLAFVDRLGAGERRFAGRVLLIATGTISDVPGAGDQVGVAWRPGNPLPDFGGPGGTLRVEQAGEKTRYIVPLAWSPDGATLVGTVFDGGPEAGVELMTNDGRSVLAPEPEAVFLGFVRNEAE